MWNYAYVILIASVAAESYFHDWIASPKAKGCFRITSGLV